MVYQVDISRRVRQQIEGLPGHMRQRVKREIAKLAFNPRPEYAELAIRPAYQPRLMTPILTVFPSIV